MEIEVNDYVRTKTGNITKVIKVKDTVIWTDDFIDGHGRYNEGVIEKTDIVKHSKNIIDLIECGDYVNGYKVLDKDFKNEMICLLMPFNEENESKYNIVWNTKYFIKSIVTNEQFSSLEYII